MVLRALVLLWFLAGPADAGCLPEGKTPKRVMFEDGRVVDGIRRQGDRMGYDTYPAAGMKIRMDTQWGLYPLRASPDGPATIYDWQGARLVAPSDLVQGKEVVVQGVVRSGDTTRAHRMTLRLIGPGTVEVAGCRYAVLHLAVRSGPVDGPQVEGEVWIDPGRMVTWATRMRILGRDGKVEREQSSRAFFAD